MYNDFLNSLSPVQGPVPSQVKNYGESHGEKSFESDELTPNIRRPKASKEAGPIMQYLPAMHTAPMQEPGKLKIVICPGCKTMQPPGKPCSVCKYPDPAKKDWKK
jgi:hypothetical protein